MERLENEYASVLARKCQEGIAEFPDVDNATRALMAKEVARRLEVYARDCNALHFGYASKDDDHSKHTANREER